MIRKTDIKRLWDVLMILKQEEDIDDVRKKETKRDDSPLTRTLQEAAGSPALKDKEFQARQAAQAKEGGTTTLLPRPVTSETSDRTPEGDRPSDPPTPATGMIADWERRASSEAVPSAASPGEAMLTEWKGRKDPVKSAGGGMHPGGGAYSKSLKKSNESKVLRIFRKYGF